MRILAAARARVYPVWLLTFALVVLAPVLVLGLRTSRMPLPDYPYFTIGLFCVMLAAALSYVLSRGLFAVHRGIKAATRGDLKPVRTSPAIAFLFGPVIEDFNTLVGNIGSLFRDMERSQVTIIGERNRNDAILRSLPGVLMTVDSNFEVTLSNDLAQRLFGLSASELLGRNIFDLLQMNDDGRELMREAFLYEQPICNQDLVLSNGDTTRHFTLNLTFFREARNTHDYCAAFMLQDITDVKRMQDLIHRSEKFLAIGHLAGGVAHELNTPLGTIVGYAQLLIEGGGNEARRLDFARRIYGEAKRCSRIIEDLRALARRDVCRPETCNIDAVIGDVVETVCNCSSKSHSARITTDLAGDIAVQGGAGQLDIVLVNLIMNAVQAAAGAAGEPLVEISSIVQGDNVVVSIADNGEGVPAAQRQKIFDPFFTTKTNSAGIGLGLAISLAIVTRIGGSLRCDSDCPDGARFILTLPIAAQERP